MNEKLELFTPLNVGYKNKDIQTTEMKKYGYKRDGELSDENNQVYYDKVDDILLLNITGTKDCNDWITNLFVCFGYLTITSRYKKSKKILEETKKKYNKTRVLITAHSLGAQIAINIGTNEDVIITYDGFFLFNDNSINNGINYRTRGDIVSFFSPKKNTINLPGNEYILNPIQAHKVSNVYDDDISIEEIFENFTETEEEQQEIKL